MASREIYIGVMSGTSLDGIDAVAVSFDDTHDQATLEIHDAFATRFDDDFRVILHELATAEFVSMEKLTRAHFVLAQCYASTIEGLLHNAGLSAGDIRAIGLHGQTIRHLPATVSLVSGVQPMGATLQLGSGAVLAALVGIDVVNDFRSADIAVCGEGAPLVPLFDAAFCRSSVHDRILLNIGGISNLTWLPKNPAEQIVAFDCGAGNMILDALAREYFGVSYDEGGAIALQGRVDQPLLHQLLAHPYFNEAPPKSTGRELFGSEILERFRDHILHGGVDPTDAMTTAAMFTVCGIHRAFDWLPIMLRGEDAELIVSGGGAKNDFVLAQLAKLPGVVVKTSEEIGIPVQQKEAIAFAYFAFAFVHDIRIHIPSATGATRRVMLGSMSKGGQHARSSSH